MEEVRRSAALDGYDGQRKRSQADLYDQQRLQEQSYDRQNHRRKSNLDDYDSYDRQKDRRNDYDDTDYVGMGVGHTVEKDPSNFSGRLPPLRDSSLRDSPRDSTGNSKGKKKKKGLLKKLANKDDDLL